MKKKEEETIESVQAALAEHEAKQEPHREERRKYHADRKAKEEAFTEWICNVGFKIADEALSEYRRMRLSSALAHIPFDDRKRIASEWLMKVHGLEGWQIELLDTGTTLLTKFDLYRQWEEDEGNLDALKKQS